MHFPDLRRALRGRATSFSLAHLGARAHEDLSAIMQLWFPVRRCARELSSKSTNFLPDQKVEIKG